MTTTTKERRVRIEYDMYPDMSYLQETEEEYAGNEAYSPDCGRCGRPISVRFGRPFLVTHTGTGRIRCELPGYVMAWWRPLTWEEYKETYGNPDNYVSLVALGEEKCSCCGSWSVYDSLGGIDFYTPGDDHWDVDVTYTAEDLPPADSYLREIVSDMLEREEAGR